MIKGSSKEFKQVATLVDLVQFRATHQPTDIAYEFWAEGEQLTASLTYAELDRMARAIAVLLQGLGCEGQPVLLLYPPGLDYICAFLGCCYASAIAVPAYPPRPNRSLDRLQILIQDATAQVALTHSQVFVGLERRFEECPSLKPLHWLATDTLTVSLGDVWVPPTIAADHLALLQYTSGSTGNPKGVMVSHGNLIHNLACIYTKFEHSASSRGVSWLPPYHDMGLVGGILQPLYAGVPIALMPPVAFLQKPLRWLEMISQFKATNSGAPNFAYDLCVQKTTPEQRAQLDLSSWQVAFSGAEPVRAETLTQFAEAFSPAGFRLEAFYPCYGMAEATLLVTGGGVTTAPHTTFVDEAALRNHQVASADADTGQALVSCGWAPTDQRVCIVEPELATLCEAGQVGEVWIAHSASVAQGYWQQPQLTEKTFAAYTADGQGPFLRTGDLGFLREGELYVTGRQKELIIIRGRNYYPKDIETTVEAVHSDLRSGGGAAFSITIEGQERLVMVQEVERTALKSLDPGAITTAVRRAIAEQHDLQLYGFQLLKPGSLPKTSSGKIRRFQCRAGYLDHQLSDVYTWQFNTQEADLEGDALSDLTDTRLGNGNSPRHPLSCPFPASNAQSLEELQEWLKRWLSETLDMPIAEIDGDRPFAEYGLDSVAAVELTEALQASVQAPLSPTLVYEYPTIEAVAAYLGEHMGLLLPEDAVSASSAADEADLADLLSELDGLSVAEVEQLLGQQGR